MGAAVALSGQAGLEAQGVWKGRERFLCLRLSSFSVDDTFIPVGILSDMISSALAQLLNPLLI